MRGRLLDEELTNCFCKSEERKIVQQILRSIYDSIGKICWDFQAVVYQQLWCHDPNAAR
jgi:hypothetical protein